MTVAVVGAGLAGLAAARTLAREGVQTTEINQPLIKLFSPTMGI